MRTGLATLAVALLLLGAPARAGEFEAGLAAYDDGDPARAHALWLPLARAGNADAQNNLGWLYEHGEGVGQDLQQAREWYRRAAASNPAWGDNLARVEAALAAGGVEDPFAAGLAAYDAGDPARARALWTPPAQAGNVDAQNNLGWLYENGEGGPRDLQRALHWYRKAAAADPRWQANLDRVRAALAGDAPPTGSAAAPGASPDAEARFAEAMRLFERGQDRQAAALLEPLAGAGHARARTNLGYLYETGRGVARDERRARDLYLLAAREGEPYAQNNLAVLLASGRGGDVDLVGAYLWFDIATRGGHPQAGSHLAALEPLLSAGERAEAARLARAQQARQAP